MNRRGFLDSILAACAAPAIVRADSLMRIVAPQTLILANPARIDVLYGWSVENPYWECVIEKVNFTTVVNRRFDEEFSKNRGDRLIVRMPNRYLVRV